MKKRTWFTIVMSLFLALMLPVTSLAASQISMRIMPGNEILSQLPESARTAVKDLFSAMSIKALLGENCGSVSLVLKEKDAMDMAFRYEPDGFFLQSAMLGDKALYFGKQDFIDFVVKSMKRETARFDENEFRQAMEQMYSSLGTSMSSFSFNDFVFNAESKDFVFDKDALLAMFAQVYGNDPGMLTYLTSILNKIVVTEGEFAGEQRDTADVCMTMTMDKEDFMLVFDSEAMKPAIAQYAAENKLNEEEAMAKMKAEVEKIDISLKMDMFFLKKGSEPVGMNMHMEVKEDITNPDADVITMDMNMNRLTTDVATYTFDMVGKEDGEPEIGGEFTAVDNKNGSVDLNGVFYEMEDGSKKEHEVVLGGNFATANDITYGWVSFVYAGKAVTVAVSSQPTSDGVNLTLEMYNRENAAAPVAPVASDSPIITFGFDLKENVSEDSLAAVKSATAENSVQILKMNDDEAMQFGEKLSVSVTRVLTNVISLMPDTVLKLLDQLAFD